MKKTTSFLSKAAYCIAVIIALYLVLNAAHYTFYFDYADYYSNHVYPAPDSRLLNLLTLIGAWVVFFLISKLLFIKASDNKEKSKRVLILSIFISFIVFALCFAWVTYAQIAPWYDQETVYEITRNFIEKDYFKDSTHWYYLKQYPQQFGLVFIESILLRIWNSFLFLEYLNALFIALAVFFSCRVCHELTEEPAAELMTLLSTALCLPLYFYVSYVYGDMFNIFACLFVTWLSIRWLKTKKLRFIIPVVIMSAIMVPAKENALIFLLALSIVFIIFALKEKRFTILIPAFLIIILPILSGRGARMYYEHAADYKIDNEIPKINWVVMGMEGNPDDGVGVGFYNGYVYWFWNELGQDKELTKQKAYSDLTEFLTVFKNNPAYAYRFYRYKALEQWNEPTFAAFYMTAPHEGNDFEKIARLYNPSVVKFVNKEMNVILVIVYAFSFICFAYSLFLDKKHLTLIIAVTFIGGFLFSLLWEAGGRYVLPYFVFLIPAAGTGFGMTVDIVKNVFTKIRSSFNGKSH